MKIKSQTLALLLAITGSCILAVGIMPIVNPSFANHYSVGEGHNVWRALVSSIIGLALIGLSLRQNTNEPEKLSPRLLVLKRIFQIILFIIFVVFLLTTI